MATTTLTYGLTGSYGTRVYASTHRDGYVRIREALRPDLLLCELRTINDQSTSRLAISDDGELVAAAGYYGGIELWNWSSQQLLWRRADVAEVQDVYFGSHSAEVFVGCENGDIVALALEDGKSRSVIHGIHDPVESRFNKLLFGRQGNRLVVYDQVSQKERLSVRAKGFGVLAACFTPSAVVFAETGGQLRALEIERGVELFNVTDSRWTAYMKLATVGSHESVWCWASCAESSRGQLVCVKLVGSDIQAGPKKSWQHATAVSRGSEWVFENGALETVHKERA